MLSWGFAGGLNPAGIWPGGTPMGGANPGRGGKPGRGAKPRPGRAGRGPRGGMLDAETKSIY